MLAVKKTAKEAWDAMATIRVGAERVRESKAQNLRNECEVIRFKPGETVDEFGIRLQELVHQMEVFGDPVDDKKVILKYLRIVPKQFKQMARSIKGLLNLSKMSIKELTYCCRLEPAGDREVEERKIGHRKFSRRSNATAQTAFLDIASSNSIAFSDLQRGGFIGGACTLAHAHVAHLHAHDAMTRMPQLACTTRSNAIAACWTKSSA
jgi:hypothetical protein